MQTQDSQPCYTQDQSPQLHLASSQKDWLQTPNGISREFRPNLFVCPDKRIVHGRESVISRLRALEARRRLLSRLIANGSINGTGRTMMELMACEPSPLFETARYNLSRTPEQLLTSLNVLLCRLVSAGLRRKWLAVLTPEPSLSSNQPA